MDDGEAERPRLWRQGYRRDRDLPWARSPAARAVRAGLLNFVVGPIFRYYGRPSVFGLENLRGLRPPFLLAANHSSHLDTPAILLALPPRLRRHTLVAAAADYFFDEAWKGALFALAVGAIAVERERPPRQSMKLVRRLLKEGWNLVVFPEGGRSADGRLHRGKRGIAHLAAAAGVPVVPVGVVGTFAALPSGYHWPRRSHVEVHFGPPLFTDGHPKPGPGPGGLRSATEGIMASIQALTGQELASESALAAGSTGAAADHVLRG
ncbi:MAG TPA: lysophospholipid acyltransferase family protein [Candidatus Nanopelagicaceae bacterium]|nr:lysophospholipid acyltransferase family protein [Candidatus Nanopelagicaceae bacterium]